MSQPGNAATNVVVSSLDALYNSTSKEARDTANTWLQEFQHTKDAWSTSHQLLLAPDAPIEYKLFAAQTFRTKVTYDMSQLNPLERAGLRETLLSAMRSYSAGPKVIMTQICLALAGLALQMPEWQNVVPTLIDTYGHDVSTVNALLEFLTVLPDEINSNSRIPVPSDEFSRRVSVLLTDHAAQVLQLLAFYINAPGTLFFDDVSLGSINLWFPFLGATEAIQTRTFECVRSWLSFGEISPIDFGQTPLLAFAFNALAVDSLFDTAVEVICDLIHETQEIMDNMEIIQVIVPLVIQLQPLLEQSKDDSDKIRGYCKIFAEAGETYRMLIVEHPQAFFPIVLALQECAAVDDLDTVPITFQFWYRLANALAKLQQIPKPFLDVYQNLVDVIIRHLQFPDDESSMTPQEWDDFRSFRHVMGDTLKDCCTVLGVDKCLARALEHVEVALSQSANVSWQSVEAPLFAMRSMGGEVDKRDDLVTPRIMDAIQHLPGHDRVRYAALLVIGRYTEWINVHPQYIPYLMSYLSAGFESSNSEVSAAAGQTMKYICKDCRTHLIPYLTQLHSFLQTRGPHLPQDDALQMYEAVAWVLTSMPAAEAASALSEFCMPLISVVYAAGQHPTDLSRDELKPVADAMEDLDALLHVMVGFGNSFPPDCMKSPVQFWPCFDTVLARYGDTYFICERVCAVVRKCIQVMPAAACLPVVSSVAMRTCEAYEKTGFSGYVWITGKLVATYCDVGGPQVQAMLGAAVERENIKSVQMLKEHRAETLHDVFEDHLHLMMQVMEHMPDSLYLSPSFPQIFELALAALTVMQPSVNLVALDFIRDILKNEALQNAALEPNIKPPAYAINIRNVIETYAFQMLGIILTGMIEHFNEDTTVEVVTIFRTMAQLWQGQLLAWLQPVVGQIPDKSIPAEAKAAFLTEMANALGPQSVDKVKNAVVGLHRASRRLQERRRTTMRR